MALRPEDRSLEWTADEIRRVGYEVVDLIADHLTRVETEPVFRPVPPDLGARIVASPLPWEPTSANDLLDEFRRDVEPYRLGNGTGRFWAWVCSPPLPMGIFAEALAATLNSHCDVGNHAASYLERQVLGWFKELIGYPADAGGILVSGGSMANLTGLAVARHTRAGADVRREGLQSLERPLVVYVSEEGHSSLRKAIELLGIGSAMVRVISTDDQFRMRIPELETRIVLDLGEGYRPIAVVASAGATNTGAIDPLEDIVAIARRHGLWFHVDGAYGAPAILTEEYRDSLAGLALADSVTIDPHKWLQVPVECGVVLVRDAEAMRDSFSLVPAYLRTDGRPDGVEGPTSFAEYGFQQTRGFRALKVWMALRNAGFRRLGAVVEQNIEIARRLARLVETAPDLELLAPPSLSVACFRYAPRGVTDPDDLDTLNRALVERIQLGGEAFLAGTRVRGAYGLRACIVNYRARIEDAERVVGLVRREGDRLVPELELSERVYDVAAHSRRRGLEWGSIADASQGK